MIEEHNTSRVKHLLHKISQLFYTSDEEDEGRLSSLSNKSSTSFTSSEMSRPSQKRKRLIREEEQQNPNGLKLPPFSPTYCKSDEFPYSNFYVKLPDGKWMIKYRSGNRDNLGTDVLEGYMI